MHWLGRAVAVTLPAEIDIANADAVRDRLLAALSQSPAVLIADMSSTTFCDSAGVRALVQVSQRTKAARAALRVVVTAHGVLRVLAISGADQLMDVYADIATAAIAPAPADPALPAPGAAAEEAGQSEPEPTAL